MASSVYDLLGFPQNDPILVPAELNPDVKMQMNLMPTLVNTWQQEDIANSDTSGYFTNPNQIGNNTANTASNLIINAGVSIQGNNATITNLISSTQTLAYTLKNTTIPAFEYHTQRMSNVQDIGSDMTHPHYELAIGYGKILLFITNKTDGIQDNSPIIGSFGSILAANAISANANTLLTLAQDFANTITITSTDDGMGGTIVSYNSSVTLVNAQAMYDTTNEIYTMMNTYRTQDTNFFNNAKAVVSSYNKVSGFSRLGQTETDLLMNHIGTDKIKTRLSS
jgi:hypothetical protein